MALTAAPLVPGEFQFVDSNGAPLAAGLLYTYAPGGSMPKTTWQDSGQVATNANPITLDAAGRAVIYGSGQYRLVLFDFLGNQIWDSTGEATDPTYIASILSPFVGDTGSGGTAGTVPGPPAGSAVAGDYLQANGTWGPLLVTVPATPAENQAGFLFVPITEQIIGAAYTLQLKDAGGAINFNNVSTATTLNIPADSSIAWPTTTIAQILVNNIIGTGVLSVVPAGGVTLAWPGSATSGTRSIAANGQFVLSRIGTNYWTIGGAGIS